MQYRTKQQVVKDILQKLLKDGPCTRSQISYGARVSYHQFKGLAPMLEAAGLIKPRDETFSITDKGKLYLSVATSPLLELVK